MMFYSIHKTLFPLYVLIMAPIFPSLMSEMCETYIRSSPQAFNSPNETIVVDYLVGEMEPTVSPSFDPPMASVQFVGLGYCMKTFAEQEVEPAIIRNGSDLFKVVTTKCELIHKYIEGFINDMVQEVEPAIISLGSDLFNAVTTKFELIRKYIEVFINDMLQEVEPAIISLGSDLFKVVTTKFEVISKYIEACINDMYAADIFDITNTKFEHIFDIVVQVHDLFDSITIKVEGFHHFSSAPMVTGNLTGSAINLGRIVDGDSMVFDLIPATGCTIPVFSLDYVLEWTDQEVVVKSSKQDESASYFMLEFLARLAAFLESIVSSILDRILLEYQRVTEKLETYCTECFAAATPSPPSSWVGLQFISACKKLEALVADFFAPPPLPPINFQVFAMKSLNTLPFVCIFLTWHAINRNRGGIQ